MKVCPTCDQTYHDDELNFCLMDGTGLLDGETQPTVVISPGGAETNVIPAPQATQQTLPTAPQRGILFYLGVTFASMAAVIGAVLGGTFLYFLLTTPIDRSPNRNRSGKVSSSKPAVKPSPTPTVASEPDVERPMPSPKEEDLVTPISWATIAVEFKGEDGDAFEFECPPNGAPAAVWGSDVYAGDSSICTAAVHAGAITLIDGGEVTIEFRPGRSMYGSTTRNGITTNTFGEFERSFVIR